MYSKKNYWYSLGLLFILLITGFLYHWNNHPLYWLICAIYFIESGYILARVLLSLPKFHSLFFAPLCALLPLFISGAGIYFLYSIHTVSVLLLLSIPGLSAFFASIFYHADKEDILSGEKNTYTILNGICLGVFFFSLAFFWYILLHSQTTESVLGPWSVLKRPIFIPYFLATLSLIGAILFRLPVKITLLSLCAFFFSSFSVLLIVFPLGFGFDSHLHQATEKIIAEQGAILPKQLYYLGQYTFVAFLSKLLAISTDTIDHILVPFLSAITIPFAALLCARAYGLSQKFSFLFVLFSLFIPFGYAIFTVPWNIASIFVLIFSYGSIAYIRFKYKGILIFLLLLALGALSIHPLAGLPLFGVFLCLFVYDIFKKTKKGNILLSSIALFFSISIPLAFFINSLLSSQFEIVFKSLSLQSIKNLFNILSLHSDTHFSAPLDFIQLIYQNSGILLFSLGICGMICTVWRSFFTWKRAFFPLLGTFICIVNYIFIEEFFSFTSLISYEQHAYADRILSLAMFFLIPPSIYALILFFKKILCHPSRILKTIFFIFFAGILTGSFYLSYPSNDVYRSFHGYNVSKADILAVRAIQKDANGEPYIVLSNQVVAAAAVKEFGFQKYFTISQNGIMRQYFYYPIPTSSPLYQYFLEMQRYPSKETIQNAMHLFNVKHAYFIITRYEDRYHILVEQAKSFANFSASISNGADMVFGYTQ